MKVKIGIVKMGHVYFEAPNNNDQITKKHQIKNIKSVKRLNHLSNSDFQTA